ncbi:MAG: flavin reductase family protein [Bryobacterales bacterium]|nr:flavin reductase family protein [Bryobacterales bacterium]
MSSCTPTAVPPAECATFREFCARFASGVTIATVRDSEGNPYGLTASSLTAVSLNPPLILVCIGHNSGILSKFRKSTHFGVNILHEGQESLSNRFATLIGDRFAGVGWNPGPGGSPLLLDCLAQVECLTHKIVDAGDHAVFFGEVIGGALGNGEPLLYFNRSYRSLSPPELARDETGEHAHTFE